jgi:hypothetical protein
MAKQYGVNLLPRFKRSAPGMDKLKLTGKNLGLVFSSRCLRACVQHAIAPIITKNLSREY